MKVGNLVKRRDDHAHHGIVVEVGPQEAIDHGSTVAKVQWNDGDLTCEFIKMLEVLSESR